MRRFISCLLVLTLLLSFAVPLASAEPASGTCGKAVYWRLDTSGLLTISGTGSMTDFTYNTVPWRENRAEITAVFVQSGVTYVGNYAFADCPALKSVTFADTVLEMGFRAFINCYSLVDVNLPETFRIFGESSFQNCIALEHLDFPASTFTIWKYAFCGCTALKSASIPVGVTYMRMGVFSNCTSLQSVTLPSKLIDIAADAFSSCTSLTSITLPNTVTAIGTGAFIGCTSLNSINIPSSITTIQGYTFSGCSALETIALPSSIATIKEYAFNGCTALKTVQIPAATQTIGKSAFGSCTALEAFNVSADNPAYCSRDGALLSKDGATLLCYPCGKTGEYTVDAAVSKIDDAAFSGCSLTSVSVPAGVKEIGEYAFYFSKTLQKVTVLGKITQVKRFTFANSTALQQVSLPDYVTEIGMNAFFGCTSLTEVSFPKSLKTIGESAFVQCALTSVAIPAGVTAIENSTFGDCSQLTDVTLPNGITSIGPAAFVRCGKLAAINLPSSLTTIDSMAFSDCSALKQVTIPSGVSVLEFGAFSGCSAMETLVVSEGVTKLGGSTFRGCTALNGLSLPNSLLTIGNSAFADCISLTSIDIPQGVTLVDTNAFSGCLGNTAFNVSSKNQTYSSLNGVLMTVSKRSVIAYPCAKQGIYQMPNGVIVIKEGAFKNCKYLTGVTIADGVTELPAYTFSGCNAITYVTLPDKLTTIGYAAFNGCSALSDISIPAAVNRIDSNVFTGCTSLGAIYVDSTNAAYCTVDGVLLSKDKTQLIACPGGKSGTYVVEPSVTAFNYEAFHDCTHLTGITLPAGITSFYWTALSGCTALEAIGVDDGNPAFSSHDGVLMSKDGTVLYIYPCAKSGSYTVANGVTSINYSAFRGCVNLTSVTFPASVTQIGFNAFLNCTALSLALFYGDAPEASADVFCMTSGESTACIPGLTLYYIDGKAGWTTPTWYDCPTRVWDAESHIHSYTSQVTTPASCSHDGVMTYTCVCGDSYTKVIAAAGHSYVNHICSVCGQKDPVYVMANLKDLPQSTDWSYNGIVYAINHGLFYGTTETTFEPSGKMTRAMLVTVLWRYADMPTGYKNDFADVQNGRWFTDAIAWAAATGLVNGVGANRFNPNASVTREQMATILYRFAQKSGVNTDAQDSLTGYPDADKVSPFATQAVRWAVAEQLINGVSGRLQPQGNATRAQVATILMRYLENAAS